jgi:uncharacterized protein YkwD
MRRFLLVLLLAFRAFAADDNEITPESVIALMNQHRAGAGLAPLLHHPLLTRAAEARMQHMADGGWWAHEAPDGTAPFAFIPIDYDWVQAGENLAAGFETVRLLTESWMESPGHRRNILGAEYAECGVAVMEGSTLGPATGKSVVVLFGRRKVQMVSAD